MGTKGVDWVMEITETGQTKEISPIGVFHSPFPEKFGIPRQSGIIEELEGRIVLCKHFRKREAIEGIEDFSYLWIVWGFSMAGFNGSLTVRPPRLGGNRSIGVFATRSPFRPNELGLSCVKLVGVDYEGEEAPVIRVSGADLMDGTPVYDIKPYIAYSDAHPDARCGFVDNNTWKECNVVFPPELEKKFRLEIGKCQQWRHSDPDMAVKALRKVLAQRPVPAYRQADEERTYGMKFMCCDVRFTLGEECITVTGIVPDTIQDRK